MDLISETEEGGAGAFTGETYVGPMDWTPCRKSPD